jgi:hypothetical protein
MHMMTGGGKFERRLAALWFAADKANTQRLQEAFQEVFEKWEAIEQGPLNAGEFARPVEVGGVLYADSVEVWSAVGDRLLVPVRTPEERRRTEERIEAAGEKGLLLWAGGNGWAFEITLVHG